MRKKVIFITGASGEVGNALVRELAQDPANHLLTMDLHPLPAELRPLTTHVEGDLLNMRLLARLVSEYEIDVIYHLAALLSTRAEITPEEAHQVNVEASLALLKLAAEESQWRKRSVQFIFPSSIAAYGLPDRETKAHFQRVREFEWNQPRTMYGCNKLYCEMLGSYFSRYYKQLAAEQPPTIDFRSRALPRPDQRRHRAFGRHQRLRARDAARRGPGSALLLLCAGRGAHSVYGHARRRAGPAAAGARPAPPVEPPGLQRHQLQPVGSRDPRARAGGLPSRTDQL